VALVLRHPGLAIPKLTRTVYGKTKSKEYNVKKKTKLQKETEQNAVSKPHVVPRCC